VSTVDARPAIEPQEVLDVLAELVAVPSPNPPGDEHAVVERIAARLAAHGIAYEIDAVEPGRPNLHAFLGPPGPPALVLNGHTDTMPPGDGWTTDPYVPRLRDGVMQGLGACDMKGGLAAMLAVALALQRAAVSLRRPLRLDFVIDEEATGFGSIRAAERLPTPEAVVVVEPTRLELVHVGHGQINVAYELRGIAAHGSRPDLGANAVAAAVRAIAALLAWDEARVRPAHPLVGPESISIGTIAGGMKTSVVPDRCRFSVDCRVAPGRDPDVAAAELDAVVGASLADVDGIRWRRETEIRVVPFETAADGPLIEALRAAHLDTCGTPCALAGLRATTDAAAYAARGAATVVYGAGDLADAHRADERVTVSDLVTAARVLLGTALRLAEDVE
jgi:acetylornithine deacetylase/succinyl-diaminopimelate desuccinylase family protein